MFGLILFVCTTAEEPKQEQCGVVANQNLFKSIEECQEEIGTGAQSFADSNGLYILEAKCIHTGIFGKGQNDA
jgi:hypothetical protein